MTTDRRTKALTGIAGASALAGAALWATKDYRAWRALGDGGLRPNLRGWLQTSFYRLIARETLSLDRFRRSPEWADSVRHLADLPQRAGSRPAIDPHPVPHRQLDQHAPAAVQAALQRAFDQAVADCPLVEYRLSYFEEHNQAVTLRCPGCGHPHAAITRGETGHIHPSDGSMHMVLSLRDAAAVTAAGWGERHGLAGVPKGPPLSYMLVYAPRDASEVKVAARILDAAIAHMVHEQG